MFALCGVLLAACGGPAPQVSDASSAAAPATEARTLVMASNTEVQSLAPKMLGPTNPARTTRLFNAALALIDSQGAPRAYLAERLPQLNTDSWLVLPDGRMETTWKLRPGLTWHDGTALASDDFVFAWRVYTSPVLSAFNSVPQNIIEEVSAPDAQTLVIRWSTTYPEANAIAIEQLEPLPRHMLLADFEQVRESAESRDAFLARRFWTTEYVGAGPFRLTGWEPGAQIEGSAFDGHALGRPKIGRVVVRIMPDDNTVATNVLAENISFTMELALRFEQASFLQKEWTMNGRGVVIYTQTSTATASVQLRPEYGLPALRDLRVRRALAHTIDKQSLIDGLFDGQGGIADTYISRTTAFYPDVDRAVTKYPYDPNRAEQLMNEAGLRKEREGFFVSESGQRFQPGFWITAGSQTERLLALVTNDWQRNGYDFQPHVIPSAQARDNQFRSTFPGLLNYGVSPSISNAFETFITQQIGIAENRWSGQNRGGWSNPQYDRLVDAWNSTLDSTQRVQRMAEMARILSEELPNYPLAANLGAITHVAALKGPDRGVREATDYWNIQDWELS